MGGLSFPSLDTVISQFENSNPSYNNPMAVQAGSFASSFGAVGTAPNGLAIFSDPSQSLLAGDTLLGNYFNRGQNLSQALQTYSGLPTGSPALTNYQNMASSQTGIGLNEIPPISTSQSLSDVTSASYALPNLPGIPSPFNPAQASQTVAAAPGGGPTALTAAAAATSGLLGPSNSTPGSGGILGALSGLTNWLSGSTSSFSFGRIGLFALALIVIVGGIFMLKPVAHLESFARKGIPA